ncbi:MAG: cytochrome c [candidate division Zixibacteria bacterium]
MKRSARNRGLSTWSLIGILALLLLLVTGCSQKRPSAEPPIHPVPNMDNQPRYETQGPSAFFSDGMAMRLPIEGTIARGQLFSDQAYHTGRYADSQLVALSPLPLSIELLKRGQNRFDIYCAPCHGRVGNGQGLVSKKGMLPPPTFHDERLRQIEDGHLFEVMTNGKGNMASYRYQVLVDDRWAIVSYIRALQRSQNASAGDLPPQPVAPEEVSPTQ